MRSVVSRIPPSDSVKEGPRRSVPRESSITSRKQSGRSGQPKWVFRKKANATKMIVRRLECVAFKCRSKRVLAIKRCKHFGRSEEKE